MRFIEILEKELGKKAIKEYKAMQPGDVIKTNSDNSKLYEWINYKPNTLLEEGVSKFASWYKNYYTS
jgi:UDP-glucuronate 4-epimerase